MVMFLDTWKIPWKRGPGEDDFKQYVFKSTDFRWYTVHRKSEVSKMVEHVKVCKGGKTLPRHCSSTSTLVFCGCFLQ